MQLSGRGPASAQSGLASTRGRRNTKGSRKKGKRSLESPIQCGKGEVARPIANCNRQPPAQKTKATKATKKTKNNKTQKKEKKKKKNKKKEQKKRKKKKENKHLPKKHQGEASRKLTKKVEGESIFWGVLFCEKRSSSQRRHGSIGSRTRR